MSFYQSSRNIKLEENGKILRAECRDFDGTYHPNTFDLNQYLGNNYGYFVWHGNNFTDSARNVRLEGSMLYADLKSPEHVWNAASIDLNVVIGNDNGRLVNADIGGNR